MQVTSDTFRRACAKFATGITVVTALQDGKPVGFTANSFTSVSLDPPLVLICIGYGNNLAETFRTVEHFAVNILDAEQRDLSIRFASRGADRFASTAWTSGVAGVPLLDGALATMACTTDQVVEAGDHYIVFGKVLELDYREGKPLIYFDSQFAGLTE